MHLSTRLLRGYLEMPYALHLRRNSAELIRNSYETVQQVLAGVFTPVADLMSQGVLLLVLFGFLVVTSPATTLGALVLVGGVLALTLLVVQPRLKRLGRMRQQASRAAFQHLQQGLGGLRDIKVMGRERAFTESFTRARSSLARAAYVQAALAYTPRTMIEATFLLAILGVLAVATVQGAAEDVLATLSVFAYAGLRMMPALQRVAAALNNLRYAEAAVRDLAADVHELLPYERHGTRTEPTPLPLVEAVAFERVSFAYGEGAPQVLDGIDLRLRRGEALGICGLTGGGKTTLLDLLCGLLEPTQGRITIDGADMADDVRGWQRSIGVVHQSSFLSDDTLRRNIAFGVPDAEIDEEALATAVEVAQLGLVVEQLPEGLDTLVGERGVRLSGGQRQRVALARAMYRQPELLILDEGTSALDNATEGEVIAGLEQLHGEVTLVMVAHRLSTIRRCDRIVFLEHGRIAAAGSYDELLERSPGFRQMAA